MIRTAPRPRRPRPPPRAPHSAPPAARAPRARPGRRPLSARPPSARLSAAARPSSAPPPPRENPDLRRVFFELCHWRALAPLIQRVGAAHSGLAAARRLAAAGSATPSAESSPRGSPRASPRASPRTVLPQATPTSLGRALVRAPGESPMQADVPRWEQALLDAQRALELRQQRLPRRGIALSPGALGAALRSLGVRLGRAALEDAVWEADDDLDGAVGWLDCQRVYYAQARSLGAAPCGTVFALLLFQLADNDRSGAVSLPEVLAQLRRERERGGAAAGQLRLEQVFAAASSDRDRDWGEDLSLAAFMTGLCGTPPPAAAAVRRGAARPTKTPAKTAEPDPEPDPDPDPEPLRLVF